MAYAAEVRKPYAPSQAERKIVVASRGHCTATAILGSGAGTKFQAESWLEFCVLLLLNAQEDVREFREQALFRYGRRNEHKHYFDVLATLVTGKKIAIAVKPTVRLVSGRFLAEMQEVSWWVAKHRFADELRIVTERDIHPIDFHNAKVLAAVREPDPEADLAASALVSGLSAPRSLRALTIDLGLEARGYQSLLRLIRSGKLRPACREQLTPQSLVRRTGAIQ